MEQIANNLSNIEWWFTGIFFILVAKIIQWLFKVLPTVTKKSYRAYQYKKLKTIKNIRWSSSAINYEIAKSQAWFVVFFITCITFLGWLAYKPIQEFLSLGVLAALVLTAPVYLFEFIWLNQDLKVKDLIRYRSKLRITKHLSRLR
ncbi:hypothetical protein [Thiomicrorhabdus cannonii]|uniref:hypothetical protein n=1 Tax=Thiomicrorhabdus cannonii TaxID=2748011 RepID=UPI0015B9D61C|nr:hypothetical protein [Thiomicrorhabdus cannonii]